MARFLSISSGSNGNCYYIGNEHTALVVDAGIGFRTIKQRLAKAGVDVSSVEMIFVTHWTMCEVFCRWPRGFRCRCMLRQGCMTHSRVTMP